MKLAASRSKAFTRYWFLTIDKNTQEIFPRPDFIEMFIERTLNDERGWNGQGYHFQKIDASLGLMLREDARNRKRVLHIRMSRPETIEKDCDLKGLSCADLERNIIYLNSNRWTQGSKKSGLSLQDYRTQLVNHEIGHLLARGHHSCPSNHRSPCPVMYQQTISKGCCRPNKWPLAHE